MIYASQYSKKVNERKCIMTNVNFGNGPIITLTSRFRVLIVRGPGVEVKIDEYDVTVRSGRVHDLTTMPGAPEIGHIFPAGHPQAGLVYAGGTANRKQHIVVEPTDVMMNEWGKRLRLDFDEAARHAAGKHMEILPPEDMEVLLPRARKIGGYIGGFDEMEYYWTALEYNNDRARVICFGDGNQSTSKKSSPRYVRCARRCSII